MPLFDGPVEQLETYQPARTEPADFDAFWQATLEDARAYPLDPRFDVAEYGLQTVEAYDLTFSGYAGQRIAITGISQGGGIAIAVAGLLPDVAAVMPNVPFLCHYRRATEITDRLPYAELTHFCQVHRDKIAIVFETLSYFDGVN